jgi:hypothetical protein
MGLAQRFSIWGIRVDRADLMRRPWVWAYDFVQDRTHDGKVLRMLIVVDEFTRECIEIKCTD